MLLGIPALAERRLWTVRNMVVRQPRGEWLKALFFASVGGALLTGMYFGFVRVLGYLETVEQIGPFITWKLTGMTLLTVFAMVSISGLIIAMTTLFYSYDLRFLMQSPLPVRSIFLDKALETAFYSSWTLALVILPYIFALMKTKHLGLDFFLLFAALFPPFLALGAAFGIGLSLGLMYLFPSSRTRDVLWILSSLSLAGVYVALRFSEPERLIRPDMLEVVAQYIRYLQAPTAEYLPSWWLTEAMMSFNGGKLGNCALNAGYLLGAFVCGYGLLYWLSGFWYQRGYSGAQDGRRHGAGLTLERSPEERLAGFFGMPKSVAILFWKERLLFFRDVRHWSQMVLIAALVMVYLFSIRSLPLDSADIRSLVSFLNIGIAGAVVAALSLRFTFPAISMEGKAVWILRAAPLDVERWMTQKFAFTVVPTMLLGGVLVAYANHLLEADRFVFILSVGAILTACWTICAMGVGFGALFPQFNLSNIHQIESSLGGFLYMAACLFYLALTIGSLAWPVKMHFAAKFGKPQPWDPVGLSVIGVFLVLLNFFAVWLPWRFGREHLRSLEESPQ